MTVLKTGGEKKGETAWYVSSSTTSPLYLPCGIFAVGLWNLINKAGHGIWKSLSFNICLQQPLESLINQKCYTPAMISVFWCWSTVFSTMLVVGDSRCRQRAGGIGSWLMSEEAQLVLFPKIFVFPLQSTWTQLKPWLPTSFIHVTSNLTPAKDGSAMTNTTQRGEQPSNQERSQVVSPFLFSLLSVWKRCIFITLALRTKIHLITFTCRKPAVAAGAFVILTIPIFHFCWEV